MMLINIIMKTMFSLSTKSLVMFHNSSIINNKVNTKVLMFITRNYILKKGQIVIDFTLSLHTIHSPNFYNHSLKIIRAIQIKQSVVLIPGQDWSLIPGQDWSF